MAHYREAHDTSCYIDYFVVHLVTDNSIGASPFCSMINCEDIHAAGAPKTTEISSLLEALLRHTYRAW